MIEAHGFDCRQSSAIKNVRFANRARKAMQNAVTVATPPAGYATITGRVFYGMPIPICFNTGSSASFIDKKLLPPGVIPEQTNQPIAVKGVIGSQVIDLFVHVPIQLDRIKFSSKMWVVTNLQAGVLLGIDTLSQPGLDVNINLGLQKITIQGDQYPIHYTLGKGGIHASNHAFLRDTAYHTLALRKQYYMHRKGHETFAEFHANWSSKRLPKALHAKQQFDSLEVSNIRQSLKLSLKQSPIAQSPIAQSSSVQTFKQSLIKGNWRSNKLTKPKRDEHAESPQCRLCNRIFASKNQLFTHLRDLQHARPSQRQFQITSGHPRHQISQWWRPGLNKKVESEENTARGDVFEDNKLASGR